MTVLQVHRVQLLSIVPVYVVFFPPIIIEFFWFQIIAIIKSV